MEISVKTKFLGKNGLSLSQAQSISNMAFQRANEIGNTLHNISNHKMIWIDENGTTKITIKNSNIPSKHIIVNLLKEKSELHAAQGFLVEAIKEKKKIIEDLKHLDFVYDEKPPVNEIKNLKLDAHIEREVNEEWGFEQLTPKEFAEFIYVDSYAAHIGQFIHKNGVLDKLRKEIHNTNEISFIDLKNNEENQIVRNEFELNSNDLLEIYESLASHHRDYEKRVNYYKAKIKNLVSEKNLEVKRKNNKVFEEFNKKKTEYLQQYNTLLQSYNERYEKARNEFLLEVDKKIKEVSNYRIVVDEKYKPVIDKYMSMLGDE